MNKTVLVVENSPDEWEFLRDLFDLRGDKAIWENSEAAVPATFEETPFDMVLIEALMPKISGFELCKSLKGTPKGKEVPVLLVGSVLQSFRVAHQVKVKYQADDIIIRPYDLDDLERKLAFYLDGIKTIQQQTDQETRSIEEEIESVLDFSKLKIAIPFAGSLEQIPLPRVLAYFSFLQQTGTLTLQDGNLSKSVVFLDGKPAIVTGSIRQESLGQLLLEREKIDQPTFEQAIGEAIESGKRLGEILIKMEAITSHDLFEFMREQAEEKILEIFSWENGTYSFTLDLPEQRVDLDLGLNIPDLIVRGIQQYWDIQAIEEEFEEGERLFVFPVQEAYQRVGKLLTLTEAQHLLDRVTGKTTLEQLITEIPLDPLEAKQILLALMMLEAVVLAPGILAPESEKRIFKPLGDRILHDPSEGGRAYRTMIEKTLDWLAQRSVTEMFDVDLKQIDPAEVESQHDQIIEKIRDLDYYRRADELTQARADFIVKRYSSAKDILINISKAETDGQDVVIPASPSQSNSSLLQSEQFFRKGLIAYQAGEYKTARDLFKQACEAHDATAEYHAYYGYTTYLTTDQKGPDELAPVLTTLNRAIEINPHLDLPFLFMGRIFRDIGDNEMAEDSFEKAFRSNTKSLEALKELRKLLLERKLTSGSSQAPKSPEVLEYEHKIDDLYNKMSAMTFFELLNATEQTDHEDLRKNYFDLSNEYRSDKTFGKLSEVSQERAEEIFQRLTDAYGTLIDTDARAEYTANMNRHMNNKEKALSPAAVNAEAESLFETGQTFMAEKAFKNASVQFKRAFEADPSKSKYRAYMAYAIYRAFKGSEKAHQAAVTNAKEFLRQAIQNDPNCAHSYMLLGRIFFEEGKKRLAEEQVEKALRSDADNFEALRLFRRLFTKQAGKKRARYLRKDAARFEVFREKLAAALAKMNDQNYFEMLSVRRGDDPDRIRKAYTSLTEKFKFESDINLFPDEVRVLLEDIGNLLNKAFLVLSDRRSQEEYIQELDDKALAQRFDVSNLNDPRKIFEMAQVMMKENLFEKAFEALDRARMLQPTNPMFQIWMGFALFKTLPDDPSNRDKAKEIIDAAIDLDERNADAFWMLGRIFQHEGQEDTARKLYVEALVRNPNHSRARRQIALWEERQKRRIETLPASLSARFKKWLKNR